MFRRFIIWWHRWLGLAMAALLILEGVTGSILALREPLERWFAPQFFATPRRQEAPLSLAALALAAEQVAPEAEIRHFVQQQPERRKPLQNCIAKTGDRLHLAGQRAPTHLPYPGMTRSESYAILKRKSTMSDPAQAWACLVLQAARSIRLGDSGRTP